MGGKERVYRGGLGTQRDMGDSRRGAHRQGGVGPEGADDSVNRPLCAGRTELGARRGVEVFGGGGGDAC